MRTDFQAGDIVKTPGGEVARVVTKSSCFMTWVRVPGQEPDEFQDDLLTKVQDWEALSYPMPLSEWRQKSPAEREGITIEVIADHDDFSDGMASYLVQPANQALFNAFVLEAIKKRKTHRHYASKAIFEHLRWNQHRIQDAGLAYKINNNYTADLARLAMRIFPELEEFFNTRHRSNAA